MYNFHIVDDHEVVAKKPTVDNAPFRIYSWEKN